MGSCFSSSEGVALSVTVEEVNAPLEIVWEVITDVPSQPKFFEHVHEIELLSKIKRKGGLIKHLDAADFEFKEGASWQQTASFNGKTYVSIVSVTAVQEVRGNNDDDDDDERIISKTSQINSQFLSQVHPNTTHTATCTVQRLSDTTCQLIGSMAILPNGCRGNLDVWLIGPAFQKLMRAYFQQQIQEFAVEAERRARG